MRPTIESESLPISLPKTQKLTNLVAELIDLVLGERPNEVTTALDVRATVTEPVDQFRTQSNRVLAYAVPPVQVSIRASKRALGQAVGNLVDDAIKFSLPGSTITFGLAPTRLEVTYLADPIADIDRDRIFERFCRTPAVLSLRWIWFGPHYRSRNDHRYR